MSVRHCRPTVWLTDGWLAVPSAVGRCAARRHRLWSRRLASCQSCQLCYSSAPVTWLPAAPGLICKARIIISFFYLKLPVFRRHRMPIATDVTRVGHTDVLWNTAELIEMPFWGTDSCIRWGRDPHEKHWGVRAAAYAAKGIIQSSITARHAMRCGLLSKFCDHLMLNRPSVRDLLRQKSGG